MSANYELKKEKNKDNKIEENNSQYLFETPSKNSKLPFIAGLFLILSGVFAIIFWATYFSIDVTTIEEVVDISQFKQIDSDITAKEILGFLKTCATIGIIIAIFPILGGILAIKRKLFGIAVACSIIGLFSMGLLFSSSVLSLVGLILLIISRKKF